MDGKDLIHRFRAGRRDKTRAVLEGFHPLKHAWRFHATIEWVVTRDRELLARLCRTLAPDLEPFVVDQAVHVDSDLFQQLAPTPPDTGVMAIALRPEISGRELLASPRNRPLVLLENPTHLGNMGAAVRVAAGAGAAGVITTGPHDPWDPAAIRGAAGLQYAVPTARVDAVEDVAGPLIAIHPEGDALTWDAVPSDAVLAFGSERRGLSPELLDRAERRLAIPMEPGVSSLNLATSVAILLYAWRLSHPPARE